jgi:YbgC/YbaW family acyl-CoA thioester hydrolase
MNRNDFRFFHRLRVRWAEVDMQKIVFNAHYLMYFDTAVADYWRALALPYEEAMHLLGGDLYVKKATVEFSASARMDDRLDIGLKCGRVGNSSMAFTGAIFRGDELLVTCELIYVFADPATQTSRTVPAPLRALLEGFEKGEPAFEVKTGTWADLGRDAQRIRTEVFVEEQRIPADLEWDEADAVAVHAVAYNRLGQAVGTGRLVQQAPGIARIGRMAVHRAIRGGGVGQGLLETLLEAAARRGDHEAMLHAQRSAEAFYAALGFAPRGEPFEEAGIAHIEMTRALEAA